MGKHSPDNLNPASVPRRRREISLDSILEEFRSMPPEPEQEEYYEDEPPLTLPGEDGSGYAAPGDVSPAYELPEEDVGSLPETPLQDGDFFPEEAGEDGYFTGEPEEERFSEPGHDGYSPETVYEAEETGDDYAPEDDPGDDGMLTESYGDDDSLYAGSLPAEEAPETEETGEEATPATPKKPFSPKKKLHSLRDRLSALLALSEDRQENGDEIPEPEIEDADKELPPRKVIKFYSSQIPALRLRAVGAVLGTLFLAWISFSCSFGWALPGQLQTDPRLSTFVCLCGELTVMLLGLDIMTSGITSLFRGRPGAESLLFLAALGSLADGIFIIATGSGDFGVPFAAAPAGAIACALIGAMHTCKGYRWSFLALHNAVEANVLTAETPEGRSGKYIICSRREVRGFIRRSEEPDFAESLCSVAFVPMAVGSLGLSLALALGGGQIGAFFHLFGLFTAICAAFPWLLTLPLFFERTARRLLNSGAAVAGWAGARDVGNAYHLIISDQDLFPTGTVELTGTRILDRNQADRIISVTGSLLAATGCELSGVFTEYMLRKNTAMCTVEEYKVGEGGAEGVSDGQSVRIGTLGYMHLSGVKIPDKLKFEDAIYTALDGEMAGVFLFRYHPVSSVQTSLKALRREHRKPIFAVRDFNIDPFLIQKAFDVSPEGFEFPPFVERYRISGIPAEGKKPISGIMARDGLDSLVEFAENSSRYYRFGTANTLLTIGSVILGVLIAIVPGWTGNWHFLSAGRVFLYDLLWLLPSLVSLVLFGN